MRFEIRGRPTRVSKEFVRAWLYASAAVLAFHNKPLPDVITVRFGTRFRHPSITGTWNESKKTIRIRSTLGREKMATTALHEVIHAACGDFGDETDEKCCSTLTARLKPAVQQLAQPLLDGTYQRAAYFAHTKLSYRVEEDHYDDDQWDRVGAKDRYRRRHQDRNGVKMTVHVFEDGTSVEADCQCFGSPNHVHSNPNCPNLNRKTGT